ncbi:hypothetical protein QAD02_014939 [Eretmocerus hayati]|uniref:Uncharacterized protein n=1 Tax=Eretmocerus hayati TaxID=131215 RepID=A0ACC2P9M9_9HYME|nr:hypothetical protein QAD02_014939 [Eretmocerus hayati]
MDFDKRDKPKVLNCRMKGPGPKYKLGTLIGFDDHDPTKHREPAYTMKFRHKPKLRSTGPGPYPVNNRLTHRGLEIPPAYTMVFKHKTRYMATTPGPAAYATHQCPLVNHQRSAAAYTMAARHHKLQIGIGPGPIYMLPTCIGPEIPDVRAEAAFSIANKHKFRRENVGPGPAKYHTDLSVYKKQSPAYTMKFRHQLKNRHRTPGPTYSYKTDLIKKRQPTFSFGVKYSPGPKYNLKTLVGYDDHCLSKFREPAYSIGTRQMPRSKCGGPGPKYYHWPDWSKGYTFPKYKPKPRRECTPGPQYTLPGFWAPAFTIVPKPRYPCPPPTSGPYDPPVFPRGPAYSFGGKSKDRPCQFSPPLRDLGPTCLVYQCPPAFSIVGRHPARQPCVGPGPKYMPKRLCKPKGFSFGVKYSECAGIPRTECDELC